MSETTTRSGTENRQRKHVIQFRADDAELAAIQDKADRVGLSIGALMRHLGTGRAGPRAVRRVPVDRAALALVLARLGQYGSNLNQIARVANSTGEIDRWGDLKEASAATVEMRDMLMEALGRPAARPSASDARGA